VTIVKKAFKFYSLPFYILTHPFDGFYDMKYQGKGTLKLALLNLFLVCLSYAFNNQYASIVVNPQNPLAMNSIFDVATILGTLLLFCVANWSVTSLTNGEGRVKDIFMAVCYAMTPLILTIIPAAILSNFISQEEAGFYYMLMAIGVIYFVFLVFSGLVVVHNYTAGKAILTIFLTFFAILVIVFLLMLLLTLWQQLFVFAYSVYTEIMFR